MCKNIKKIPNHVRRRIIKIPKKGDYVKIVCHPRKFGKQLIMSGSMAIFEVLTNPDFHSYSIKPIYRCRLIYKDENYSLGYYPWRKAPKVLRMDLAYGEEEFETTTKLDEDDVFIELL